MEPETLISIINFLGKILPFLAPIILGVIAWRLRLHYVQGLDISKMEWVNLQVKIPRDVFKSPQAMEFIFMNAMYQTFPATWYARNIQGLVRSWFSVEIVSIEGKVYFFIHVLKFFKNLVESQIYAQYPKAEIDEVPDYTEDIANRLETEDWNMWGCEFKFTKPDGYPIKTYVDYGLDKDVGLEEEQKIDPITPMVEFMGSLGSGEQAWFQVMLRASMKRFHKPGTWFGKQDWVATARDDIKKIELKHARKNEAGEKVVDYMKIPKGVQDEIAAINRSIDKLGYDVGIRCMYLAKKEVFNKANYVGLISMVKQYNSANLNGFSPTNYTDFDYPWQDVRGFRTNKLKKEMFDAYRLRAYFYPPHNHKFFVGGKNIERKMLVLNSEELATIYHFPGQVSETPTFTRIESKKSEPPSNLPF